MNFRAAVRAGSIVEPFGKCDAEIVERNTIRINALMVGATDGDELGRKIKDLPKFILTFAQCFFGLHAFFNVEVDSDPIEQCSVTGSERLYTRHEPTVSPLRHAY